MTIRMLARIALVAASLTTLSVRAAPDGPSAGVLPAARAEYRAPQNPAHMALYAEMRERRILERFVDVLSVMRLPRTLTLAFAGCDGSSNAWYQPQDATVTFCYEYLAEMRTLAATRPLGKVPLREASDGPAVFVMLHESGHAVFDLLKVPVLGREEDAADTFAAVVLLRLGQNVALRTLRGAAWAYLSESSARKPEDADFADSHGLDAQRYYNILCMAYGSDPVFFASAVAERPLPADRAEGCADEYRQAIYAFQKLIVPSVDAEQLERLRVKHKKGWSSGQ